MTVKREKREAKLRHMGTVIEMLKHTFAQGLSDHYDIP
jgi:hypothetical protein